MADDIPAEVWQEWSDSLDAEVADWKRGVVTAMKERHEHAESFCGGPGSGVPGPCADAATARPGTARRALAAARGIQQKVGGSLAAFIDKAPGGQAVRQKLAELKAGMESRYGKKTAVRILAAANAISWGAFVAGPLVGHPNYIPASGIALAGAALAEGYLQARRGLGKLARHAEDLGDEQVQAEARALLRALVGPEAERFCQEGANAGKPGPCPETDHKDAARKSLNEGRNHAYHAGTRITASPHLGKHQPALDAVESALDESTSGPLASRADAAGQAAKKAQALASDLEASGRPKAAAYVRGIARRAALAEASFRQGHEHIQAHRQEAKAGRAAEREKDRAAAKVDQAHERRIEKIGDTLDQLPALHYETRPVAFLRRAVDRAGQAEPAERREALRGVRDRAAGLAGQLAGNPEPGDSDGENAATVAGLRKVARLAHRGMKG